MLRLLVWATFLVALGVAHIRIRLTTREMEIQSSRLQADGIELRNLKNELRAEVSRLSGEQTIEYARRKLGFREPEKIEVWALPRRVTDRYAEALALVATSRSDTGSRSTDEPLAARLLGALLSPEEAQARPAGRK
jgi:hypothetical protein